MKRFKNILLVCNFDAKQRMAVERAVSLARQNEARLMVLTVIKELPADARMAITAMTPQELLELVINDRQEKVDALAANIGQQGVDVSSQVVTGTPFLEIIRQVLRDKHDLVILAAEGKGGLKERLFGSTSMHLGRYRCHDCGATAVHLRAADEPAVSHRAHRHHGLGAYPGGWPGDLSGHRCGKDAQAASGNGSQ